MMSEEKKEQTQNAQLDPSQWKAGPKAFVALIVAILFFSGLMLKFPDMKWLSAFDFTTLVGKFGTIQATGKATFVGSGGVGARGGFLFALSLIPSVMFALGMIEVLDHYGAIRAAQRCLTPLLKPLCGLPGLTGLALITDLQSTDAGAVLTKGLYDDGLITKKELVIMGAWQYSGAGMIGNYFMIGSALFGQLTCSLVIPFTLIFLFKFVGAIYVRAMLNLFYKGDFKDEQSI
jgi:nucleoside recognition membrane protein YjiH